LGRFKLCVFCGASPEENKTIIRRLGGVSILVGLSRSSNEKIKQQATRALMNMGEVA
jgi:Armadillo/beta-catenin-like repeat